MNKIKFIYGLVGLLIAMILVNVVFDVSEKFTDEELPVDYSKSFLTEKFFDELNLFGIEDNWIAKKRIWNNVPDSIKYYYKIKTPTDLTIPEIVLLMSNEFNSLENTKLVTDELQINGKSIIEIFSNNVLKFRAQFEYDPNIKRIRPNVSFIVNRLESLSDNDKKKLLEISYPCALMIVPTNENKKLVNNIGNYDKDFVILLNDDISGELYELDPGFSKSKIKRSIANIVNDFSNSGKYFIDSDSDLFKSVIFSFLKEEFRKKKITLYRLSTLKNVSKKSEAEKRSFLAFHFNDVESKEKKIFNIEAEDYINLQPFIEKFKRKGNKFVPLSE